MLDKVKNLVNNLTTQLYFLENENQTIISCSVLSLEVYKNASVAMKKYENKIVFANQLDEIDFYKIQKPLFLSHYFFHSEVINFEKYKLENRSSTWIRYFQSERQKLLEFNFKHSDYLPSLIASSSEDDKLYFKKEFCSKGNYNELLWTDLHHEFHPKFDVLRARFLALQDLEIHLIDEIKKAEIIEYASKHKIIPWNGSTIEFFEHFFGLFLSGKRGHKNSKFSELLHDYSNMYGILIQNHFKLQTEIGKRTGSKTRLYDLVKEVLVDHVESKIRYN